MNINELIAHLQVAKKKYGGKREVVKADDGEPFNIVFNYQKQINLGTAGDDDLMDDGPRRSTKITLPNEITS